MMPQSAPVGADGARAGNPVTFYLVRHGQTLFNVMGKMQGWCDTPLTAQGIESARSLGRGLASVEFVAAFSSDSGRAVQTLDEVMAARAALRGESFTPPEPFLPASLSCATGSGLPFPLAHDARLREWCYGDLEGEQGSAMHRALAAGFGEVLPIEEHNRRLPEVADAIAAADRSGRAERFDVIAQRLRGFFCEAAQAVGGTGGGNVLVVTHSFAVRTMVYLVDPSRVNDPVKMPNASVTQLVYDDGAFSLDAIGSTAWLA